MPIKGKIILKSEKNIINIINNKIAIIDVIIFVIFIFLFSIIEDSTIIGIVKDKNKAIIHPFNKLNEIKAELIQLSIIPTKSPYLQPCNSGLERSSNPIIGNKLKINANRRIGNNSYNSS